MSRYTPIVMYHEIAEPGTNPSAAGSWTVSPAQFAEHLDALARGGYTGVSVAEWLGGRARRAGAFIVLTFDDGCAGDVAYAVPALAAHGWTATFFVISGSMGQAGFGTAQDWRNAVAAGMDVASHTATHPFMGALSETDAAAELRDSRRALEAACGASVVGLSWPNGDQHPCGRRLLREAGYEWACTSRAAFARAAEDRFNLPRLAIRSWHDGKGLLRLIRPNLWNRARMGGVWRAKAAARAMLGRKRYADMQMGFRDDG